MSEFRASSIIDEALGGFGQTPQAGQARNILNDPRALDTIAVSAEQGNDLTTEEGIPRDLLEGSYDELVVKYGEETARNALRLRNSRDDLQRHRDDSRGLGQVVGDAALDASSALVGLAGNTVGAAAVRPMAWAFGVDADTAAAMQSDLTNTVSEFVRSGRSDKAQTNSEYMAIQQELDMADNAAQREEDIAAGDSEFWASAKNLGRDFFDASKNIGADPTATGELVAGALGSLGPSAALARGASIAASKGVGLLNAGARTQALAGASGAIAAIGATEASGTYAETMNEVMGMSEADLSQSPVYAGLIAEGYSSQEAQVALANMTAEQAFLANLPAATALGVLTRRFETAPIGSFKGSNMIDGLRSVMAQGVEEAGQGAASAASQNFAINDLVDETRSLTEGVGQSAAEGLIGGLGQAGVAAVPATTVGAARGVVNTGQAAADALFQETRFEDPVRDAVAGSPSVASRVGAGVSNVAEAGRRAAQAVSPAVAMAVDVLDRSGAKENKQTLQDTISLRETLEEEVSQGNVAPEVVDTAERVTETTARFSERGFRPTPQDTSAAAVQIQELAATVDSLPPAAKRAAGKVLASKMARKIQEDAAKLDLNKEPVSDPETVVNVAKTNPANVDPDQTDQILEMSDREMSEQDSKILRAASKVARVVNSNVDAQVEIREDENVQLSQIGEKPKRANTVDEVSRQILAKGYETPAGKKLRSINDFAADIIKGVQSAAGTILDAEGRTVPVAQVAKEFSNFIQHMENRVQALNTSFDQNRVNEKTGRMTGPAMKFRGLVNADKWVEAENWTGSPVTYHRGSPGSVAFAKRVAADRDAALEVYNALKAEFPEAFDGQPDFEAVTLKTEDNPTVLDEDTQVSEEQNQETQEQTEDPTAVEESGDPQGTPATSSENDVDPTVNEVDSGSRDEEVETEASAEVETDESSETGLAEQDDDIDAEDADAIDYMENPERWDESVRQEILEKTNDFRNKTRALIEAEYGPQILKRLRQVTIYPETKGMGPGYAWVKGSKRQIYISAENFDSDGNITPQGKAVILHEMAHVIDYTNANFSDDPGFISDRNVFQSGGAIYNESLFLETHSPWVKKRMKYANSYKGTDDRQHRAELFAVMTEFYFSKDPTILENSPAILDLMEEVYGPRTVTEATGTTTDAEVSTEGSTSEESGDGAVGESGTDQAEPSATGVTEGRKVNPQFSEVFQEVESDNRVKNMDEYLTKAEESGANSKTLDFVRELAPVIRTAMANRLQKKVRDGGKTMTILEHIKAGKLEFNPFRAGMFVDPETGQYDENMLDLATVALVDWLITNTGSDPNRMEDTLEKMGVGMHEINDDDLSTLINGVPPSNAADTLAADILRMWDVKPNSEQGINMIGAAEAFAKEMFTALSEATDLISIPDVEILRDGERVKTQTIMVKNKELNDIRKDIQAENGKDVKMTAREVMFGDNGPMWQIGNTIPVVARTQNRNDVALSRLERRALKKMQDTPNFLDETVATVLAAFPEGMVQKLLGHRDDVEEIANPVLRRSVRGKNASVLSDIDETIAIVEAMSEDPTQPAYFPVGITKVGRHQYQGPNPQSNKLMRSIVTPTWSTFQLNNLNNFWIAVGQASDIKGINKAEKLSHADIVANASSKFYEAYGDQVAAIKTVLQGGEMDAAAFDGVVMEAQQLKAVIAVAQMEVAVENGDSSFRTSLSFELDGLTNGVANMMVNYGQGEITNRDFMNFKRVGFFLGKAGETVNRFFGQDDALDMYEVTSRTADQMMHKRHRDPEVTSRRQAAGRVATVIGDFEMVDGQFRMTRNSSKNPMTKVNYGSGVQGVAVGIADSMLLKLYEEIQVKPENVTLDEYFYPGFSKDMRELGLDLPNKPGKDFVVGQAGVKRFQEEIKGTIGQVLTEATQDVIGQKIKEVNDMLVFSTNVQSQYLRNVYMSRLEALGERLANEGVIKRSGKENKPQLGTIPQKYFRELEKELSQMAPIFVSEEQTLAIGGFAKQLSDFVTSTNFDARLNQKARMPLPDEVGVRAIPFSVIGSGDAMMMNLIFGSDGAPNDVLGIFDGLDIPADKIQEYAPYVNQQVAKSWGRDVLSMAVQNFRGFVENPDIDQDALETAYAQVADKNKNTSVVASNPSELMVELDKRLKANQARKRVFGKVAVSVDQMGGSDVGFSRDGQEVGLTELNQMIQMEMEGREPQLDVKEPVFETTSSAVLKSLKLTEAQKRVVEIIAPMLPDVRVVFGTVDQINQWRIDNVPDNGQIIADVNGAYDPVNGIVFLTKNNPETVLHELVHAATYNRVLDHYNGNTNEAVTRLEALMEQFLDIDGGGQNVRNAQSAINRVRGKVTPEAKAAAVNEFMAYALTNPQVRGKLEKTQANLIASLKSNVIKLLRRMMGGVPQDMFSQVVFNTRLLDGPPVDNGIGGDGGNGDGGRENPELTPPADNYTNYWIQQLAEYIDSLDTSTVEGARRKTDTSQDIINADKVLDDLRQVGLLRNPEDRQTFRAIYGIMKSEMVLDSASLIALTKVFQHVEENLTPEMFGNDSEANQTYSAILNAFGAYQRGETSDAVAVLFALSQTSAKFREALDQIPEPETQAPGSGLNAFLARGTNIFMKKLMGSLEDGAPQVVLDGLKQTLIDADREKEYAILRRATNTLTQADEFMSGQMSRLAEGMRGTDRKVKEEAANTVRQYLVSAVTFATNFLDKPGSQLNAEAAQKAVHMGLPILSIVPVRELVDEFVGTNRENRDFVAMMDVVNSKISGMRQAFREQLPGILQDQFSKAPVAEQWKAMQKTLAATDFTSFVTLNNMQRGMQILEESGVRRARIQKLEGELQQKLVPYVFQDAKEKAEQLASFMNGNGAGKLLMRNAYAIAKNLDGNFDESIVPIIDELVSLYAVDTMDADIREETVQMWQNEPQAVTALVAYIQGLNEAEDQKQVSEAAKLNGYKGYIPNIGKDNHRIIVARDEDEEDLRHQGYRKVAPFSGEVDSIFPRSYYVTNISQQGMYSQGIMQNVASTYRGVDVNTGLTVTGDTSGFISGDGTVDRIVTSMNEASYVLDNDKETLLPVFAGDGTVMGFERSISPDIADQFLGRDDNLATNLGAWAGRQVEEELAGQYNRALIDKLDDLYQNRESGDETFVNLKESKDPIYKEAFKLIPQEIKAYADSKFEGTGLIVPESMVNLSVGYREASVADLWTGKTRMPKELVKATRAVTKMSVGEKSIRTLLVRTEQIAQGIVSDAKDIIVVKSLVVPVANTQANVIQLATNGVPVKTIVKEYRKKLGEITEYNKNVTKLIDLRARQRLTTNANQKKLLQDKIQVIEDLNARMSIAPMIAAGAYKQLSEGITDFDSAATSGGLAQWLEAQADKMPETLGTLTKNALVSKSTDLYRGANRATQYGDFLAKSIYYDHLLQKGHTEAEALAQMNEEFVNFSALPGRVRSMLERNGLTWFMAFKIRIAKIAQRQMRDNPVRALAVNAALDVGSPIQDNIFTVIGEGRLDYATGYEMLFGAPELNPWINLMNR